jgi:hypothetical protein
MQPNIYAQNYPTFLGPLERANVNHWTSDSTE